VTNNTVWIDDRTFLQSTDDSQFYNDPYRLYQELHHRGGPVHWQNYGFWCLTAFDDVNTALKDKRFARLPPPGSPVVDTPKHLHDFYKLERHSLLQLEPPRY